MNWDRPKLPRQVSLHLQVLDKTNRMLFNASLVGGLTFRRETRFHGEYKEEDDPRYDHEMGFHYYTMERFTRRHPNPVMELVRIHQYVKDSDSDSDLYWNPWRRA